MRQINVPVADDVYEAAKVDAANRGMLFKKFVERALMAYVVGQTATGVRLPSKLAAKPEVSERTYEPIEDV